MQYSLLADIVPLVVRFPPEVSSQELLCFALTAVNLIICITV